MAAPKKEEVPKKPAAKKAVAKKRISTNYSQSRARKEQEAEALYDKLLGPYAEEGWSRGGMVGSSD